MTDSSSNFAGPGANPVEKYRDHLPGHVRGRLTGPGASAEDRALAAEIEAAAARDPALQQAIREETRLDEWLDAYKAPEISADFERRFWHRFHHGKLTGETGGWGGRIVKLAGPIAAAALIAVALVMFWNGGQVTPLDVTIGETPVVTDNADDLSDDVSDDEDWSPYYGVGDADDRLVRKLDLESLRTMKQLDSEAFLPLDNLSHPDDLRLVDDLETLKAIDELDNGNGSKEGTRE